jgi:hypothetical protein
MYSSELACNNIVIWPFCCLPFGEKCCLQVCGSYTAADWESWWLCERWHLVSSCPVCHQQWWPPGIAYGHSFLDVSGNMKMALRIWYCSSDRQWFRYDNIEPLLLRVSTSVPSVPDSLRTLLVENPPSNFKFSSDLVPDCKYLESGLLHIIYPLKCVVEDRHLLQQRLGITLTSQRCMKPWWRWWSFWITETYECFSAETFV